MYRFITATGRAGRWPTVQSYSKMPSTERSPTPIREGESERKTRGGERERERERLSLVCQTCIKFWTKPQTTGLLCADGKRTPAGSPDRSCAARSLESVERCRALWCVRGKTSERVRNKTRVAGLACETPSGRPLVPGTRRTAEKSPRTAEKQTCWALAKKTIGKYIIVNRQTVFKDRHTIVPHRGATLSNCCRHYQQDATLLPTLSRNPHLVGSQTCWDLRINDIRSVDTPQGLWHAGWSCCDIRPSSKTRPELLVVRERTQHPILGTIWFECWSHAEKRANKLGVQRMQ